MFNVVFQMLCTVLLFADLRDLTAPIMLFFSYLLYVNSKYTKVPFIWSVIHEIVAYCN